MRNIAIMEALPLEEQLSGLFHYHYFASGCSPDLYHVGASRRDWESAYGGFSLVCDEAAP